jgi:multiple sugar transport system permease protein
LSGNRTTRAERRLALLLCTPAVTVMLAVAAFPILYALWLSLHRADLRAPNQNAFIGLDNYVTVLSSPIWWDAFGVTLVITVVSTAIELVLGMALAVVMHRTAIARGLVRTVTLIPYGIVTVVAAFSWRYAWTQHTGWLAGSRAPLTDSGSAISIIILAEVWKTTPFMALLLLAGLVLVPQDVLNAAAMDGATPWQRFRRVTLPMMKPAILVAVLFRAMDAFRIFDNIFVLTDGAHGTASVSIVTYDNLMQGLNLGIGSALSVLIVIAIALIAFLLVRMFGARGPSTARAWR